MAVRLQSLRPRPQRASRSEARPERALRAVPAPAETNDGAEVARHRRAGGPEDVALYTCACGYAFEATVTACVGCPHCGADQAW
jgi:rubrerythrin